jgi:hypothetical protein
MRKYIAMMSALACLVAAALSFFTRMETPKDPSDGSNAHVDDDAPTTRKNARRRVSRRQT